MTYNDIHEGIFLSRPNRFVALVDIDGQTERCHVKNTGRCRELLVPGTRVYVNHSENPNRATRYDLVAVWKGTRLINMDSQAPNKVFYEYLQSGRYMAGLDFIRAEVRYGSSRFDFYMEAGPRKIFLEVKGVTLEEHGAALFPDAPTLRGVRHLNELAACLRDGYEAHMVFVVQMDGIRYVAPNNETHPAFGTALAAAHDAGVTVAALDCIVTPDSLRIGHPLPVKFG